MKMSKLASQRGLSFLGFIMGALILVVVSMFGLKLIPPYLQNAEIAQMLVTIASDPEMQKASAHDVRASFNKRASINNITAIKGEDLDIASDEGRPVLSASYSVKVPLVANMTLYLDFNPSSAHK